jgi:cysteinyl-tRNA synthetase
MRTPRVQDTLSGQLRELVPREDARVGVYACGPTVYGPVHVGNARPYVVFSLLKRFLEREGYEVTYVVNVTDVNDKIYAAAREAGVGSEELAREMTRRYEADTDGLGLGRPDHEPKASETIGAIVDLIQALLDTDHAYATGGDVYFRVGSFADYGKLSNRSLVDMDQGEDDVPGSAAVKESPHDFALWKARKEGEDTAWPAPWGEGRPGWHIECSAMAESILGLDFEIHGGGSDLVFPHHENEIAQTEAGRGRPLARIWMHNGMVQFGDEKMAKSVGNIRGLREALDEVGPETLVMYFAGGHYRQPLAYTDEALDQARARVARIREVGRRLAGGGPEEAAELAAHAERFFDRLADDFNTPGALAELFGWVAEANRRIDAGEPVAPGSLPAMLGVLGLERLLLPDEDAPDDDAVRLLEEREEARRERDFATADARRDELAGRGWEVRDTPDGPRLVRAD